MTKNIDLDIEIRPLSTDDSIEELTSILHISYKALADMGYRYWASHQDAKNTQERIEKGKCFVTIIKNKMIGTICYYPKEKTDGCNWYDQLNVASFGQFAVLPNLQRRGIGSKLLDLVEKQAEMEGVEELALDTAEGAAHLIKLYEKRGYRFIEYAKWQGTNYRSVIMSKKINK